MRTEILMFTVVSLLLASCGSGPGPQVGHDGHGEEAHAEDFERGPHGGRLLRDGDFALEVTIFEEGVPPEYHLYGYAKDQPLPPADFQAEITLGRLGGRVDRFRFAPVADFLRGDGVVREPHSFDVAVVARHAGRQHEWKFESYQGRTTIAPEIAKLSNLVVESAGPAKLREEVELTGTVQARGDRSVRVQPRFPGVVRELRFSVGDKVPRGAVLAIVQSNESLESYGVVAPSGGTVLERGGQVGEVSSSSEPLFVIADLSSVWVELDAFGADLKRLAAGQPVAVEAADGSAQGQGKLVRIAPVASAASQSVRARVLLDNAEGAWRPGQFVRGRVLVAETAVPLVVKHAGLQQFRDFQVVFAQVGDTYEVRMLELGRADRNFVEVLGGLEPGERYVTENSFLVKADIEKSGASHDH
jgi:cobalt-zinc-cadmium efflux system membrane fusion protein